MNLKDLIDKGVEFLTSKKATYILLFLALLIIGHFIIHPNYLINEDTITFAIPAYHLANGEGLSNAPCYVHGNEKTFWHPPLYMVLQSVIYKLLGFSFFTMHILPIILWFIFIGLLYKYLPEDKKWIGISCVLFLSIVLNGVTNRPDILMGIFAILLIANTNVLVLGAVAGLALMTHAFGIFLVGYAFLKIILSMNLKNILTKENFIKILQFSGIILLISTPYILYVLSDFNNFLDQFVYNNYTHQTHDLFSFKKITDLYKLIFVPIIFYFLYEVIKDRKINLNIIFAIILLIYTVFFTIGLGLFYRHIALVIPFIIFSLNFDNKKLISLVVLINIMMLIAFLGINLISINYDSVYDCERNFQLIENKNNISLYHREFFFNPKGNCDLNKNDIHLVHIRDYYYYYGKSSHSIPRHNYNISDYNQTKLCNIYAFDFTQRKMSDYSYVLVEK